MDTHTRYYCGWIFEVTFKDEVFVKSNKALGRNGEKEIIIKLKFSNLWQHTLVTPHNK
jgi:hypothetical protein